MASLTGGCGPACSSTDSLSAISRSTHRLATGEGFPEPPLQPDFHCTICANSRNPLFYSVALDSQTPLLSFERDDRLGNLRREMRIRKIVSFFQCILLC